MGDCMVLSTYAPGPSHVHVTVSNLLGYLMHTGCTGTPG